MTGGSLAFWLDYVEANGGLTERHADRALALLPEALAHSLAMAEHVLVTTEPDLAREEGALLLAAGHPALTRAAEAVLEAGDVAVAEVAPPRSQLPDRQALQERARERIGVEHGRIDAMAAPLPTRRAVLRIGALAEYATGADEHFYERLETWIDLPSRLRLPASASAALSSAQWAPPGTGADAVSAGIDEAVVAALADLEDQALLRRADLARDSQAALAAEFARAGDYYAAALASLLRRRESAPPDRVAMLDVRAESVRAERDRRLGEIRDKHEPKHTLRPYRAHLMLVPVLRLDVDVRRGERRYPVCLDWVLPVGDFAALRCPACGGVAGLVAGRSALGCTDCQPSTRVASTPRPTVQPDRPQAPSFEQAPAQPMPAQSAPAAQPARPDPAQDARAVSPQVTGTTGRAPRPAAARSRVEAPMPVMAPRRIVEVGDRVATGFWRTVASGEHRKLARLCAPDSPAAAGVRLYGTAAPLWAIRADPGLNPDALSTFTEPDQDSDLQCTSGTLSGRRWQHHFSLVWRMRTREHLVEEVTDGTLWFMNRPTLARPRRRGELDRVADALVESVSGPMLLLRSLAAWWRVPHPGEILHEYDHRTVAAALHRGVSYWSRTGGGGTGGGGTYASFAAQHRVDEDDLRAASAALQRTLRLSARQPW
ncbi:MAG: hypothetical protein ACRDWT_07265 [Jatrophihabitantaceae bacterium]